MEIEDLLCPMIASWLAIPAAGCLLLSFYFLIGISNIIFYILIGIFSIGLLTIAIIITLCYKTGKLSLYKIAYYISLIFIFFSIIFFFGFFISNIIYLFINLSSVKIFDLVLKFFGVAIPLCFFISMLFNIIGIAKKDSKEIENEDVNEDEDSKEMESL